MGARWTQQAATETCVVVQSTAIAGQVITASRVGVAGYSAVTACGTRVAEYITEFSVVEDVERFRPELQRVPFGELEVLKQSHVEIDLTRVG